MADSSKLRFKDITSSEAYQSHASSWASSHIFTALLAAAATAWFGDARLGWHWFWVFPALLFGISVVVAFPTMLIQVWLASLQSGHMKFNPPAAPSSSDNTGRFLQVAKLFWSFISLALAAYASFLFVSVVGK